MFRIVIAGLLLIGSAPAFPCPAFQVDKTFEVDRGVAFSFKAADGYEAHVMELPDTLLRITLRPEGVSAMDMATGKVSAPTLLISVVLRPISEEDLALVPDITADTPFIELPGGVKAYREDIADGDIRHFLYPEIDGDAREIEVMLQVPQDHRGCMADYEEAAREVVASLSF